MQIKYSETYNKFWRFYIFKKMWFTPIKTRSILELSTATTYHKIIYLSTKLHCTRRRLRSYKSTQWIWYKSCGRIDSIILTFYFNSKCPCELVYNSVLTNSSIECFQLYSMWNGSFLCKLSPLLTSVQDCKKRRRDLISTTLFDFSNCEHDQSIIK